MGTKGKRVKFVVEPNEEISEFLKDEELRALNEQVSTKDNSTRIKA